MLVALSTTAGADDGPERILDAAFISADDHLRSVPSAFPVPPEHVRQHASYMVTEKGEWGYNSQEHICGYAVVRLDALTNCNFALPGIHMLTINQQNEFFRDPFHRLNHRQGMPIDTYYYEPARHTDWFWYMAEEDPVRLPYGFKQVRRGRHWILAQRVTPRTD